MVSSLLCLSLLPLTLAVFNPKNVIYAVNCGGPRVYGSDGIVYLEDFGYSSGITSDHGLQYPSIKGTQTPEIYQTERYSLDSFSYGVPLVYDGLYTLILKFSEVYFDSVGKKVFSVKIGDMEIIQNLDIYSKVGKAAAHDEYIEIRLSHGVLTIGDQKVSGGWEENHITFTFLKTEKDNPKINGIVLVRGSREETGYEEYKAKVNNRSRLRNWTEVEDELLDFEEVEELAVSRKKDSSIVRLIFSPPVFILTGILFLSLFFLMRPAAKKSRKRE